MSYAHIVPRGRVDIEFYCLEQKLLSYIATKLKGSKSTINYELKRCQPYNVLLAQADYDIKRGNCGCRRSVDQEDVDYILAKLKQGWSPESIVCILQSKSTESCKGKVHSFAMDNAEPKLI